MSKFTLDQKIAEIKRELSTRRRVYPEWIITRRLTKQQAEDRLGIFEEILQDLQQRKEQNEGSQSSLFIKSENPTYADNKNNPTDAR